MKVQLLEGGYLPERAHFDDAGLDLRTPEAFTVVSFESYVVDLKVCVQIPVGYCGELKSKSGLNVKYFVESAGGIIDSSYRGSIRARIKNEGKEPYTFERGEKVCQLVIYPVGLFDVEQVDELDPSVSGRDKDGFGSTGR